MVKGKGDKGTNNNLNNTIQKTKDYSTNPTKTGYELMCSSKVNTSYSTSATRRVTVKQHNHHVIWKSCWTPVCVNTNNINKTRIPYKTNGITGQMYNG